MQTLKSPQNIGFLALVILVLSLQMYYMMNVRSQTINQILNIQQESLLKQTEIMVQEKNLSEISEFEEELRQVHSQTNGITSMLPTVSSDIQELIEFRGLMAANGFKDLQVEQLGQILHEDEKAHIIENQYQLTYISTYTATKEFLLNLRHSNQLINISSFEMTTAPQEEAENGEEYGSQIGEVIQAKIVLSTFCLKGEGQEETYIPYIIGTSHVSKGIENSKGMSQQEEIEVNSDTVAQPHLTKPQPQMNDFYLNLWDTLVAGENFTFSGPAPLQRSFTGLRSGANVYVTLTLREDGYDVSLEDEEGKVQQNSVQYSLEDLKLIVDSNIARIKEVMPTVQIFIRNYTNQMIEVQCKGSNLDLITIYNEYDEMVKPGEVKGKVKRI
ncbi:hypothetical protein CS063_02370 [Sporanaerobium hydrogeniformans]|uniref:Uncharacterized protein n=1 Tax=Sporanaerobium hydrogeniformans TaxID=3072179 RepID=A0AC61DHT2_9FIRM|nr:hypothetical protein [Sporanaerobium hydrogeniformans]PHV72342.1 hypothetical protein CS063_02370 [Sporanaerobium hydrogeniformans]